MKESTKPELPAFLLIMVPPEDDNPWLQRAIFNTMRGRGFKRVFDRRQISRSEKAKAFKDLENKLRTVRHHNERYFATALGCAYEAEKIMKTLNKGIREHMEWVTPDQIPGMFPNFGKRSVA